MSDIGPSNKMSTKQLCAYRDSLLNLLKNTYDPSGEMTEEEFNEQQRSLEYLVKETQEKIDLDAFVKSFYF